MSSFDLYQSVTDQIISYLDAGTVPWRSPILGRTSAGHPRNLESGRCYRGVNVFLLALTSWSKGFGSSFWMTFQQAKNRGGAVKKGEKASMVVFWKMLESVDRDTGEKTTVPILRYYNVFNLAQIDGITSPDAIPFEPVPFTPQESAEAIVNGYKDGPMIEYQGNRALYRPSTDTVCMPDPTRFVSNDEVYSTLFHELAHSTGHSSRLNRKLDIEPHPFGSPRYATEELISEMAAAFLSGHAGIQPTVIENQAAYLAGWIKTLKGDKRLVITAAGAAQKASDWILGERPAKQ